MSEWERLRALPAAAILKALGAPQAGGHHLCPRCKSILWTCDDANFGVSIRCALARCRLGTWEWPERALAELAGSTLDVARKRLLEAPHAPARQRVPAAAAEPEWITMFATRAKIGEKVAK